MTGGHRSGPDADGGTHHGALFESFPDPLLVYASESESESGERDGGGDAIEGSLVVSGINPAFETAFDVSADEVGGTPLDGVVLAGTVAPDPDADSTTADTDGPGADEGDDDPGARDPVATATMGSILDRVSEAGGTVTFEHLADGGTRYFHVRTITAAIPGESGYLLFTDVTGLERERRELATAVARLERLASVARHDLRNPLEVAEIRLEAARDTGEEVHFEKVAGALDRIERIVEGVLTAGGGSPDATDTVSLEDIAEAAWETVDTADATLVTAPGLPTVRGDADRIRGLFENLFRNSVEHGGRDVTVRVEPHPGGFVVADDGPGIPEEARSRAFDAGSSTTPTDSGLGLSIVRDVVREHGWHVSLAADRGIPSDADTGARFEFDGVDRVERGDDAGGSDTPDGPTEPDGSN